MTEEEIKNLRRGDVVSVDFLVVNSTDSAISIQAGDCQPLTITLQRTNELWLSSYTRRAGAKRSRAFEVGDTVRIVPDPLTGTVHSNGHELKNLGGMSGDIRECQLKNGTALVDFHTEWKREQISVHCLALVRKKDKRKKDNFSVDEIAWAYVIISDAKGVVAEFSKDTHPNAKAAAEAECARLNAEWRKQQEGGEE